MANPSYTNDITSEEVGNKPVKIAVDPITGGIVTAGGGSISIPAYDSIALTYVASGNGVGEIETATYSSGGASVGVATYTYNADGKVATISFA